LQVLWTNEQDRFPLPPHLPVLLVNLATHASSRLGIAEQAELSLAFVDDAQIQRLNRSFRGLDYPTDVLSFAIDADEQLAMPSGSPQILGDVVISLERAAAQAAAYEHSLEREVAFLMVHGLLHLVGFDHQVENGDIMEELTESILSEAGLQR